MYLDKLESIPRISSSEMGTQANLQGTLPYVCERNNPSNRQKDISVKTSRKHVEGAKKGLKPYDTS